MDALSNFVKPGMLFLFQNGKVFLLHNHHQYLEPERAQKVLLGKMVAPKNARDARTIPNAKIYYYYDEADNTFARKA